MQNANNVVSLPESMERQWQLFANELRRQFVRKGADPEMIEAILARVRPVYMSHVKPTQIPDGADLETVIKLLNQWVFEFGSGLLMEIVVREIELFRLRG
jgi:hypothetical protein